MIGLILFAYAFFAIQVSVAFGFDLDPIHPVIGVISAFVSGAAGLMLMIIGSRELFVLLHDWQYARREKNLGWFEDKDEVRG